LLYGLHDEKNYIFFDKSWQYLEKAVEIGPVVFELRSRAVGQ